MKSPSFARPTIWRRNTRLDQKHYIQQRLRYSRGHSLSTAESYLSATDKGTVGMTSARLLLFAGMRHEALKVALLADNVRIPLLWCWSSQWSAPSTDAAHLPWQVFPALQHPLCISELVDALFDRPCWIIQEYSLSAVLVRGDTATAHTGVLAGQRQDIALMHLEAGLRDDSLHKPFPEDIYRSLVSAIAAPYLARSLRPRQHLLEECIAPYSGTCNKSTAIDQLPMPNRRHKGKALDLLADIHRRKRLGNPTHRLAHRLHKLTEQSAHIALTSLPNLRWADRAQAPLSDLRWLPLISPAQWIHTTSITKLVLNGSGGTCEEPPYLGMPLLMFRQATERPEPSLSRHTLPLPCDSADMTSTIISALRCAQTIHPGPARFYTSPHDCGCASAKAAPFHRGLPPRSQDSHHPQCR